MNNSKIRVSPTIGVYLGSTMGNNPYFKNATTSLGEGLAELGYTLVYGGGGTGLMGVLAKAVKARGGKVIGITTEHLSKIEKPCDFLDELHVVHSMYERKSLIHERSSRFLAMPGGMGTFDELFETWCAIKIGTINKPLGLVNIDGYFNPMLQFVTACTSYGFLNKQDIEIPTIHDGVSAYLKYLEKEQKNNLFEDYSHSALSHVKNKSKHLIDVV